MAVKCLTFPLPKIHVFWEAIQQHLAHGAGFQHAVNKQQNIAAHQRNHHHVNGGNSGGATFFLFSIAVLKTRHASMRINNMRNLHTYLSF
jgi:hypothetical protein